MKVIKQGEIEEGALTHDHSIPLGSEDNYESFKVGAEFAEKKIIEMILGNQKGSLDDFLLNATNISQEGREVVMEALYDYFNTLKEYNE